MNIYEQQAKNKRKTVFLVIIFILFFLIIGIGFDYYYLYLNIPQSVDELSRSNVHKFIPYGTIISLLFSTIMVIYSFKTAIKNIIIATDARLPDLNDVREKQFVNTVAEMAIAAGLPMPGTYIVDDYDLNAFATGFSPEKSYIFVTKGLLNELNREELQAVVAHEMSHIRFYDIRLLTAATVLLNTISIISDTIIRSSRRRVSTSRSSRSKSGGGGILFLIWIILVILAPIIAKLITLAISREREYLADAGAAELTRNPRALASALEKIRKSLSPTRSLKDSVAYMCITDPRGSLYEEATGWISNLFATHPPLEKRILALKLMAYENSNPGGKYGG